MILALDRLKFRVGEQVSGEVSVSGDQCCLILNLTCIQKLKITRQSNTDKMHKTSLFNIVENLTEPNATFHNVTFPFTFRLSPDFPSTFHLSHTTIEGLTLDASLTYKVKAKLIKNDQVVGSVSQSYTVVGYPTGQANFSVAEFNETLVNCCPWSLSIRIQVPEYIKLGDSAKNFRVCCTRVPKHCQILRIEGKIQYKAKIGTLEKELVKISKTVQEAQSSGDNFCMMAAIQPFYGENNCSFCSGTIESKFRFCVTIVYRFCCRVKRSRVKFNLYVTPKDVPEPKIDELPLEFTLHQLKTIELKNRLRAFTAASYRKTAATADTDSVIF